MKRVGVPAYVLLSVVVAVAFAGSAFFLIGLRQRSNTSVPSSSTVPGPRDIEPLALEQPGVVSSGAGQGSVGIPSAGTVGVTTGSGTDDNNAVFCQREGSLGDILRAIGAFEMLKNAIPILGLDLAAHVEATPSSGDRRSYLEIRADNNWYLRFAGPPLHLRSYHAREHYEDIPSNLTLDDAMPSQVAKDKARELLTALQLDFDVSQTEPYLDYVGGKDHLAGAAWIVSATRTYQGYATSSHIRLRVSAYSGKIRGLSTFPLYVPDSMEVRITEEQAQGIVHDFAKRRNLQVPNDLPARLEIVEPNSLWNEPGQPILQPDMEHPRLAYVVGMEDSSQDESPTSAAAPRIPRVAFVDAATGGIIGGFRDLGDVAGDPAFKETFDKTSPQ